MSSHFLVALFYLCISIQCSGAKRKDQGHSRSNWKMEDSGLLKVGGTKLVFGCAAALRQWLQMDLG